MRSKASGLAVLALLALVSAAGAQDTTITIKAFSSTLEFVPSRIALKAGTRVKIRFVNEGTYPHNFLIPKKDDDIDQFAELAAGAGEHGFIPLEIRDKLIAYTGLAGPNETTEVTFIVPPAGTYTYVCLFPGHQGSMLGTLRALK